MKKNYLIVGAGLFGSILARELTNTGYKCKVIDKRGHTGGNCYTQNIGGINVHKYGPHIFHTSKKEVLNYLLKHTTLNNFSCRPKLQFEDKIYSFPINLMTINQLWGITIPYLAKQKINNEISKYKLLYLNPQNAEELALCKVGKEIYDIFYKGYLIKQWNTDPKNIPIDIMKRQEIRFDYNDSYYPNNEVQGVPNYTKLFESLLEGIDIELNTNFLDNKIYWESQYTNIIYTGQIDAYFDYIYGPLEYRSLKFEEEHLKNTEDYQGTFMVSYPESKYRFTRIIEHKHFDFIKSDFTIITKEYSQDWTVDKEPFYPVNTPKNQQTYEKYLNLILDSNIIFGGRLGLYKYLNMDQTIEEALNTFKKIINVKR